MRLQPDAPHDFGGVELDQGRPISFLLDGRRIRGLAGDTVLSAVLAAGITAYGTLAGTPMALSPAFAPLVSARRGGIVPMDRTPALDGLEIATLGAARRFALRQPHSLGRLLDVLPDPPWLRTEPVETLAADLLVIGGGVAGLSAAEAASAAGRSVILCERRPWLGGDARYFGPVGDEESPEAVTGRLIGALAANPGVRLLTTAEVFALGDGSARLHHVEAIDGGLRSRVLRVDAPQIVLATGANERLPIFPGNRLPGVVSAIDAYHFGKRYGAALGETAVVAAQNNYAYRLALRLHDAGVTVRRIVDTRIHPQSRFVDFAKASGLTLASGQMPTGAQNGRYSFAPVAGSGASVEIEADQLIVAGPWQPDLTLWMLAGGGVEWSEEKGALVARDEIEHVVLAGSAAGYRSLRACVASGRAAVARLAGGRPREIDDAEPGTALETPEAPTPIAPMIGTVPSFLDAGRTLVQRPTLAQAATAATPRALSLGDVAALVELGLVAASDAGAIAEERGAPGADLNVSDWAPPAPPPLPEGLPSWLVKRFGDDPQRLHLIVDGQRTFPVGALVYSNAVERVPDRAIGVIVEEAHPGGIALVGKAARRLDRFIVETGAGPSPARPKPMS